jgi:hypothetical protein
MRIRLLGVGVKMGIVDGGHAQSDDVIRCPETFADHEYMFQLVLVLSDQADQLNIAHSRTYPPCL